LSVLTRPDDEERIANDVFRHTTTIGLRRRTITRRALEREVVVVRVGGANVRVKVARLSGEIANVAPEFEDCASVSRATGRPLDDVVAEAAEGAKRALS